MMRFQIFQHRILQIFVVRDEIKTLRKTIKKIAALETVAPPLEV